MLKKERRELSKDLRTQTCPSNVVIDHRSTKRAIIECIVNLVKYIYSILLAISHLCEVTWYSIS